MSAPACRLAPAGPADALLAPGALGPLALRNRLAVAPMTRVSATVEGLPTARMARYYEGFARGGFGLVISEGLYTDTAHAQGYLRQPGLAEDAQADAWTPITAAARARGTRMVAQLMHAGALLQGNRFRDHAVAPSAVRPTGRQLAAYGGRGRYDLPRAMTEGEIEATIDGFARSAWRAVVLAGFDAVELHAANGYLLDQFISAGTNQRGDHWGGDARTRLRLPLEVLRRVQVALRGRAPVGIRISQGKVNDFQAKWPGGERDAATVFTALAAAAVDFIHVTDFEAWQPAFAGGSATLADLARRYAPGVPLIVNGGLHDVGRAVAAVEAGADIVALGRGALANPDAPRRLARGLPLRTFDPGLLGPLAVVKDDELDLRERLAAGSVSSCP